ncbi:MAG: YfhO family protein [Dysgonomonas sp.]
MNQIYKILSNIEANKKSQFWVFFAVLVLMSLFMTFVYGPIYSHPGYDYYFHLKRFEALITALREGNFPIYIDYSAALNYGYLSKMFYSDIILVPFALLGLFLDASIAYEVMLFAMTLLCGLFMYKTINTIYKSSFVAFIGAILYTFSVYRLFDVYNRGALGEVFAFTFIPLVFLGLYHIIKGDYRKWYIIAIGFSLLIFSHVISSVLTFITVVILLIIYYKSLIKEPKRIYYLIFAGIITLVITASYILPMWEQMQSNVFRYESNDWTLPSRAKLPLNYILWALFCGFIYPKDITIVGIGILLTLVIFIRLFVKEKSGKLKSIDIGVLIGIFYVIASSSIFPWGRFPFTLLSFIQYPSRLYLLVTLFFSVAGGYYLSRRFIKDKQRLVVAGIVLLLTGVTMCLHSDNYKYMYAEHIRASNENPTSGNFFYLNGAEYVPDRISSGAYVENRGDSIISLNGNTEINNYNRDKNILYINISTHKPDSLELPLFYYKGYYTELNEKEIVIAQSDNGLIQIPVDEAGNVKVYYKGTTIQKISWYVTIIGIFVLCIYIFVERNKEKRSKI